MSKPKDTITNFWINAINELLSKLKIETINPDEFLNLIVHNTEELINITVICKNKTLVLALNESSKKLSGGWKYY